MRALLLIQDQPPSCCHDGETRAGRPPTWLVVTVILALVVVIVSGALIRAFWRKRSAPAGKV